MLEVKLVCVGKLKEAYWRDAVKEYAKRLSAFCRFSVVELEEARLPADPSPAEIAAALEKEADRILAAVGKSRAFPLVIEGELLSSEALAKRIGDAANGGESSLAFLIGSSFGLSPRVKALGPGVSMSRMTFPHQLARVMLAEQIYRAFTILHGSRYHK